MYSIFSFYITRYTLATRTRPRFDIPDAYESVAGRERNNILKVESLKSLSSVSPARAVKLFQKSLAHGSRQHGPLSRTSLDIYFYFLFILLFFFFIPKPEVTCAPDGRGVLRRIRRVVRQRRDWKQSPHTICPRGLKTRGGEYTRV